MRYGGKLWGLADALEVLLLPRIPSCTDHTAIAWNEDTGSREAISTWFQRTDGIFAHLPSLCGAVRAALRLPAP